MNKSTIEVGQPKHPTVNEQKADIIPSAQVSANAVLPAVCSDCGNELDDEEKETPYKNQWDKAICDNCYREKYQEYCPVCEHYFDKPEKPTDSYFIVSKEGEKEAGIKMGVYHVLDYPVFSAAVGGFGSTFLWEENFELMRECDVNSMLKKLHGLHHEKLEGAVKVLIEMRNKARADKDFALSDYIRDRLTAVGIELKDGKEGTTFSF